MGRLNSFHNEEALYFGYNTFFLVTFKLHGIWTFAVNHVIVIQCKRQRKVSENRHHASHIVISQRTVKPKVSNSLLAHNHNPLRCWGVTIRINVWYHDKN